jgi:hypothetical protein
LIEDLFDFVDGAQRLPGFGTSATVEVGEPAEPASGSLVEERDLHRAIDDPALGVLFGRDLHSIPPCSSAYAGNVVERRLRLLASRAPPASQEAAVYTAFTV